MEMVRSRPFLRPSVAGVCRLLSRDDLVVSRSLIYHAVLLLSTYSLIAAAGGNATRYYQAILTRLILARDAFVRTNRRAIAMMSVNQAV